MSDYTTLKNLAAEQRTATLMMALQRLEAAGPHDETGRRVIAAIADTLVDRFGIAEEYRADEDAESDYDCLVGILAGRVAPLFASVEERYGVDVAALAGLADQNEEFRSHLYEAMDLWLEATRVA